MMGNYSRILLLLGMLSIFSPAVSAMCWAQLDKECFSDCKKFCSNDTEAGTPTAMMENLLACVQVKCNDRDDNARLLELISNGAECCGDFDTTNERWWLVRCGGQIGEGREDGQSGISPSVVQVDLEDQVEAPPARSTQVKRSVTPPNRYAMGHFRWGSPEKVTIRKRRPARPNVDGADMPDYNGVEGLADDTGVSVSLSRRDAVAAAATAEEDEDDNGRGFHVPPPFKRYGGFMKMLQEIDQLPLVPIIRKVMHKESTKSL